MKKWYVVYGIEFADGSLYVGSTRDLTKRMYEHKFRSKKSNLQVYKFMREQDFYEFVIMDGIETRKEAYALEKKFTQLYAKIGYTLVNKNNIDREREFKVDGRRTEEYRNKRKGAGNPNSKPKEYFATTSTQKSCFKTVCRNQDWNYEDFIEILDTVNSRRIKKYYYIVKEEI